MTMKTMRSLMLAALSLGIGTVMAQESRGSAGPYETMLLSKMLVQQAAAANAHAATASILAQQ
jgi:hypothetical protein